MTTVECELCQAPTPMVHTKRCDRCWELERRLVAAPDLAMRILDQMPRSEELQKMEQDLVAARAELARVNEDLEVQKQKNVGFKAMVLYLQEVKSSVIEARIAAAGASQTGPASARSIAEMALSKLGQSARHLRGNEE